MRNRLASEYSDAAQPSGTGSTQRSRRQGELSFFELGSSLLRYKKLIGYTVGVVVILTATVLLLMPNEYTSKASILPSGPQDKLSDLKSLAGLGSIMSVDENSSELYPSILRSRVVADAVLDAHYTYADGKTTVDTCLADYLDQPDRDRLYLALDNIFGVDIDKKTGIIKVAVETEHPQLSRAILTKYLAELENFNLYKRRSQAKENARYLAAQLEQKSEELKKAEDALQEFQTRNQNWFGSTNGDIVKELSRYQREVEIRTQAYGYLTQQYEIAKLDAQKDVPIVRTLDDPSLPIRKSGPFRSRILIMVTLLTTMAICFGCLVADSIRRRQRQQSDSSFDEFRQDLTKAFPRVHRFVVKRKREQVTVV